MALEHVKDRFYYMKSRKNFFVSILGIANHMLNCYEVIS